MQKCLHIKFSDGPNIYCADCRVFLYNTTTGATAPNIGPIVTAWIEDRLEAKRLAEVA